MRCRLAFALAALALSGCATRSGMMSAAPAGPAVMRQPSAPLPSASAAPAPPRAPAGPSTAVPRVTVINGYTSKYSYEATRLPEVRACNPEPDASYVGAGPAFEAYTVRCVNGESLAIQCDFGMCRVLRAPAPPKR